MHPLTIKITNINNTHRKVYRTLRTTMGLNRSDANLALLGYIMGQTTTRNTLYEYITLTDNILKTTIKTPEEEKEALKHEWEHYKEVIRNSLTQNPTVTMETDHESA